MTKFSLYAATTVRARRERRQSQENRPVTHRVYPIHRAPKSGFYELSDPIIFPDGRIKGQVASTGETMIIPAHNVAYFVEGASDAPAVVGAFDPDDDHTGDVVTAV